MSQQTVYSEQTITPVFTYTRVQPVGQWHTLEANKIRRFYLRIQVVEHVCLAVTQKATMISRWPTRFSGVRGHLPVFTGNLPTPLHTNGVS